MKILQQVIEKQVEGRLRNGDVKVIPEVEDDMYYLYNLIAIGDLIEASTVRNVILESKSGARDKSRIQLRLTIEVVKVEFDAEQCSLRLNGINRKENEHIKLGQHHTIELELNRPVHIHKENWDSVDLDVLEDAGDPTKKAEIAAVVLQEGLASICLVKSSLTKVCAKIERTMPKKKEGNKSHSVAMNKFFEDIYQAMKNNINFDFVKVVLVGR
eukprot:gene30536-39794_t